MTYRGTVKSFNSEKGYGFIECPELSCLGSVALQADMRRGGAKGSTRCVNVWAGRACVRTCAGSLGPASRSLGPDTHALYQKDAVNGCICSWAGRMEVDRQTCRQAVVIRLTLIPACASWEQNVPWAHHELAG